MSIEACAELVRRGDPDRFLVAMSAKPKDRAALFVLWAFNLEVARAPWVTAEAMIAEMRLQWWRDAIDEIYTGKDIRRHEVVTPLGALIQEQNLPREPFDALITARSWDIYKEPHSDEGALQDYLAATSGGLMRLGCLANGAEDKIELATLGRAGAVARLFLAVPELENAQKYPLVDGTEAGVIKLAKNALDDIRVSRKVLKKTSQAAVSALRSDWMAIPILKQAIREPALVGQGGLGWPEGRKKLRLIWLSLLGGY